MCAVCASVFLSTEKVEDTLLRTQEQLFSKIKKNKDRDFNAEEIAEFCTKQVVIW
jgi:hypothetical protein